MLGLCEYKIKIDDRHPQKQEILKILKETDWKNEVKGIAMARLKQYMIFKKLRECGIEELKIKEENLFEGDKRKAELKAKIKKD